ncbi:MAG: hypothetical protein IPM54_42870 [Polyangiaceae bacterium]|nr:hypothetical protein [Polyangiaceae bacterium]
MLASSASCERKSASVQTIATNSYDPLPELREFEAARRAQTDFVHLPSSDHAFGADPYTITPFGDGKRFVSILRGRDAIVVLDASLQELQRLPAPPSPSGVAVSSDGKTVFVVGERAGRIERFVVRDDAPHLEAAGRYELPDVRALRDVAVGPEGALYAVEEDRGRLISLVPQPFDAPQADSILPARRSDITLGGAPVRVVRVGKFVITNCLLAHALVVRTVDDDGAVADAGETRITHDGPIWSFSARPAGDDLLVLAGGVEDHPLDRRGGFFGYIDSFVFLYKVHDGAAERLSMVNVSEFGVVTPKAVELDETAEGKLAAFVTGYGGESLVRFVFGDAGKPPTDVRLHSLPGGSRAIAKRAGGGFVIANPLLDAFVTLNDAGDVQKIVPVVDAPVDASRRGTLRLGEALFFTTLMAPKNKADDAHSRFTCETCHFEGHVDGRIHHTGRGDVRVVTKPLLGLFNNRPHFSRALDPDLSSIAHNEFRVAGAGNDYLPWFSLEPPSAHPTLSAMQEAAYFGSRLPPLELRKALMTFLMAFSHRTNPAIEGRSAFSALESEGARVFRDRCESCHQARTSTDDAMSRVTSFNAWESHIFSSGPIVWAMNEYRKTGVEPYVHERGARVPSLRRLYKKRPYLTSGAAKDLQGVLDRVGWTDDGAFFHDGAPEGAKKLDAREAEAMRAFLELL